MQKSSPYQLGQVGFDLLQDLFVKLGQVQSFYF